MNQRQHPRLQLTEKQAGTLRIRLAAGAGETRPLPDATVTDISLGGVGFVSPQALPLGTPVQFRLPGGNPAETLAVKGEISWSQPFTTTVQGQETIQYRHGVRFAPGSEAPAALQTERAEAARLAEIGRIISSTLDIHDVYERVAAEVRQLLPFDRMTVSTVDLAEETMTIVYTAGVSFPRGGVDSTLPLRKPAQTVIQQRQGHVVPITAPDQPDAWTAGLRSAVVVPLVARGEAVGVLALYSIQPNAYDERNLELAEQVGMHMAEAIANALAYAEVKRAEAALRQAHDELEQRVKERTATLAAANQQLQQEVSERQRVEAALRESEARYRVIFDRAPIGLAQVDLTGRYIGVNRALQDMLGYSAEDLREMTFAQTTHQEDVEVALSTFEALVSHQQTHYQTEQRYQSRDDRVLWSRLTTSVVRDAAGAAQFAIRMVEDITAQKDAEQQEHQLREEIGAAQAAAEAARQADELKSEFLSRMSHELRTPLTAIIGFAELLDEDLAEPLSVQQRESIQHVREAGDHLLQLVNEVLDLARIEAGRLMLFPARVVVGPVIAEALAIVAPMAAQRRIRVSDQTAVLRQHAVIADSSRLKQVLLNLLTNAIKYNREAGAVTLDAEITPDQWLRLNVRDTGPGILDSQRAGLFEPFERLGAERTEVEGTGIGLTITKRLLELMGGRVEVESAAGEGSCFTIELPLAVAPADADGTASLSATGVATAAGDPELTVLYIEDHPSAVALVERILARRPHLTVLSAPQARMGLDLARSHRPNLIVLDINLPGMDGFEALQWLRRYDETRAIPVIALSASAMPSDVERGLAAGFSEYLTKPIHVPDFLAAIDRVLG